MARTMLTQCGREARVNSQLEELMSERLTLPVLPLREIVLFPGVSTPIGAGRPTTLRAIEAALKGDSRLIFAVSQRENVDHVTAGVLYTTGTLAKISQIQRGLGGVQLLLHGEKRGVALHYVENQGHLEAVVREVEDLPPLRPDDAAFVALHREVREGAAELGQLADLVAGYLEIDPAERQALLETLEVEERLRRVLVHVQRQIGVLDAQEHIKSQVQEELGERQRELFLREQMKAIRKELGEGDEASDVEELRKRLAALELPEAAQKEVDRELARLERAARDSMEAQVIRTYLETVAELPWNKRAEESLDLKRAAAILDEDHYGLQDVKDEVLEFLSVRQLRQRTPEGDARGNDDDKQSKGSILLFVGPPGVGKTSMTKSTNWASRSRATRRRRCWRCSIRRRTIRLPITTSGCRSTCRRCCSSRPRTCCSTSRRRCSTGSRPSTSPDTPSARSSRSRSATCCRASCRKRGSLRGSSRCPMRR